MIIPPPRAFLAACTSRSPKHAAGPPGPVGPNGGRGDGPDRPVSDETLCRAAARGIGRCPHPACLPTRIFSAATLLDLHDVARHTGRSIALAEVDGRLGERRGVTGRRHARVTSPGRGQDPGSATTPSRWAIVAASTRLRTPSLARMLETWTVAVLGLMNRVSAISPVGPPDRDQRQHLLLAGGEAESVERRRRLRCRQGGPVGRCEVRRPRRARASISARSGCARRARPRSRVRLARTTRPGRGRRRRAVAPRPRASARTRSGTARRAVARPWRRPPTGQGRCARRAGPARPRPPARGLGAGRGHRAVGSLRAPSARAARRPARHRPGARPGPRRHSRRGAGQLGAIRGRAQPQRVQRGGEDDVRAGDPEPFGHGRVGVPRAALRDGQLRRRDEQRASRTRAA